MNPGSIYGLYSKENDALNAAVNPGKFSPKGRIRAVKYASNSIDFDFRDKKDYFMVEISAPEGQNKSKVVQKFDSETQTFTEIGVASVLLGSLEVNLLAENFTDLSEAEFAVYRTEEEAKKSLVNSIILKLTTDKEGRVKENFPYYSDETFYVKQTKPSKCNVFSKQIVETNIAKNKTSKVEFRGNELVLIAPRIDLSNNHRFLRPTFKQTFIAAQKNKDSSKIVSNKKVDTNNETSIAKNKQNIEAKQTNRSKTLTEHTQNMPTRDTQINNNLKKENTSHNKPNSPAVSKTGLAVY